MAITGAGRTGDRLTNLFDVVHVTPPMGQMMLIILGFLLVQLIRINEGNDISIRPSYYINITNLKQKYTSKENADLICM